MNRRNLVAWFVMAAAGALVGAWWQWGDLDALREQRRIWNEGVVARVEAIEVDEDHTSGEGRAFLFRTYHYEVRATYEVDGRPVRAEARFATLLRSVDREGRPELRFDPKAPERFVTSWSLDRLGAIACFLAWKWCATALWVTAMLFGALVEIRPHLVEALEDRAKEDGSAGDDDAVAGPTPLAARVLGGAALVLVVVAVLSLSGMFFEDVVRRFGSYLEDALGLLLGGVVLTLAGAAVDLLRRTRVRA